MTDAHLDEQWPLSPADDFMIHQTPDPIRIVSSSDHRAYERYWTVCHDDRGEVLVATGGSFYPNLDLAEAYAIVNVRGQHRSVRAFRRLGADRMNMHLGPIKPTVIEGLRRWRYVLDDNEWGITYDLEFADTTRQVYREPGGSMLRGHPRGRRSDVTTGFEGFGVVSGSVTMAGETIDVTPATCTGTRDRHWGIGRNVGGPAMQIPGVANHIGLSGNNFVAFKDFSIWGDRVFYRYGDERPAMNRVTTLQRRLRFEPDTRIFLEGLVDYRLDTGDTKQLRFERVGYQTAYLRCGMYGGTPDQGIHQGMYVGDNAVQGDTYDVTLAENRVKLAGLDEHQCRVSCDGEVVTGIYQPIDPDAYEACAAGRPGWAFLEE
jgi:hypothetical protein